jgi:hypothetical protein
MHRSFVPALFGCLLVPRLAAAFCGFFVSGTNVDRLENDATTVILVREGTRTVLSMQNNYVGPPEDFALVIPVPTVLGPDDVRVLPPGVFDHVTQLTAPRLVEYWEQDPCGHGVEPDITGLLDPNVPRSSSRSVPIEGSVPKVTVEAEFVVGEYEIVLLGSEDSLALEHWLRDNDYAIPEGASELLRPYVAQGSKFFVAKVDTKKLRFVDGEAVLSPLRMTYESEQFSLPIRLGMINAPEGGAQDLIVHVLGGSRYEVANYDNVAIPTNLEVTDATRDDFEGFYAGLFDHTMAAYPGAVVTEYAWAPTTCDPCPIEALNEPELTLLGRSAAGLRDTTLTRLHLRYDAGAAGEDLVFRAAEPIRGGGEIRIRRKHEAQYHLEQQARVYPNAADAFQARYSIRHRWEGEVRCSHPVYEQWGPPPRGRKHRQATPLTRGDAVSQRPLDEHLLTEIEAVTLLSTAAPEPSVTEPDPTPPPTMMAREAPPITPATSEGCAHCSSNPGRSGPLGLASGLGLLLLLASRRRHRSS